MSFWEKHGWKMKNQLKLRVFFFEKKPLTARNDIFFNL